MHLPSAKLTVWRFTPNITDAHPSPKSYITATAPILTLEVPAAADKTADPVKLSFPGGRVYSPETAVSSAGLWIVVPDKVSSPRGSPQKTDDDAALAAGPSDYTITVAANASLEERYAADRLQHWLQMGCQCTIPIARPTASGSKQIAVGSEAAAMMGELGAHW